VSTRPKIYVRAQVNDNIIATAHNCASPGQS